MTLKVFTNDVDTFVADSLEDLRAEYKKFYFDDMESNGEDISNWEQLSDDYLLTIKVEKSEYHPMESWYPENFSIEYKNGYFCITAKVSDWANANGRGLLCSTEC